MKHPPRETALIKKFSGPWTFKPSILNQQKQHKVNFWEGQLKIIYSITLIAILGVASITPAFPKIQQVFEISETQVGLLITAFTLPGIFLTLILGVLADRLGRKTILIPSLFLFGLAGGACAFVDNFNWLLILRFVQGIGGASLGSLNVTIIGDLYNNQKRPTVMGYNASVLSIGTAAYPAIGGGLATLAWFYPFFLPFLAIPVGVWILYSLPDTSAKNDQDLRTYLKNAWGSVKNPQVITLFIASISTFIILYGSYLTYFPFLMDQRFAASSVTIGLMMSGMSVSTAFTSAQLGKLIKRISEKKLLIIAFSLYAIATFFMLFIHNIWLLSLPVILFGIAQGINVPNILSLISGFAPAAYRAAFMSLNGMVLRLGQTLGPVLMGLLYGVWKLSGVFLGGAFLALVTVIMIIIFIRGRDH